MVTEQDLTEYLITKLNEKLKQNDNDCEEEYIASNRCYERKLEIDFFLWYD